MRFLDQANITEVENEVFAFRKFKFRPRGARMVQTPQQQHQSMSVTQLLGSLSLEAKIGIVVAAAAVIVISKFAFGSASSGKRGMYFRHYCGVVNVSIFLFLRVL